MTRSDQISLPKTSAKASCLPMLIIVNKNVDVESLMFAQANNVDTL